MMNWDNYECEGQMSLFDFMEKPEAEPGSGAVHRYLRYGAHTLVPEVRENVKAHPDACRGTIQECRFGGPFKWSAERIGKK